MMTETLDMSVLDEQRGGYDCSHGSAIHGDMFDVLPQLPENEFHAIVCDPPYNFDGGFMQRQWDDIGSPKQYQLWCQDWSEKALATLKPGGHLIAFSGNRSHHRLMSGVEDAGYEIRGTITWHYGEGMPKGSRLSTWLDGEETEKWGDWRGTLKPATEFAVLARSPLGERSATQNQVEHGVGNLNVEACRTESGRFPPNLVLDATMADVIDALAGDVAGGDERGDCDGERDSGFYDVGSDTGSGEPNSRVYADEGGASRFFYCSKAAKSERNVDGEIENDHETVKPVDLMEWLVKLVTAEGQKVLDPFVGSGTTLIAADNVGREAVGVEMDEEYAELARDRFDAATGEQ
jgi:DNA modification methylase